MGWSIIVLISLPVFNSHNFIVKSQLPVAKILPSGLIATATTARECPGKEAVADFNCKWAVEAVELVEAKVGEDDFLVGEGWGVAGNGVGVLSDRVGEMLTGAELAVAEPAGPELEAVEVEGIAVERVKTVELSPHPLSNRMADNNTPLNK